MVDSQAAWGKWPYTADTDFSPVLAQRWEERAQYEGIEYVVECRYLPAHMAYRAVGFCAPPPKHPYIDNTKLPPDSVMNEQVTILRGMVAEGFDTLRWWGAIQCYAPVACHLKSLFKRSILHFNDDCPGVSETKAFPVASYFDALLHGMYVWSFERGERVTDLYRARGVKHCYFKTTSMIDGLEDELSRLDFDICAKAERVSNCWQGDVDVVFVGYAGGNPWRSKLLKDLSVGVPAGLKVRLHGVGAAHGVLEPRSPTRVDWGVPVARLYAGALFGANLQQSSLFNERLFDYWRCGVAQLVYDPHGELIANGFLPEVHYIAFDGSSAGLYRQVLAWKAKPQKLAELIRNAHTRACQFMQDENSMARVMGRFYAEVGDAAA